MWGFQYERLWPLSCSREFPYLSDFKECKLTQLLRTSPVSKCRILKITTHMKQQSWFKISGRSFTKLLGLTELERYQHFISTRAISSRNNLQDLEPKRPICSRDTNRQWRKQTDWPINECIRYFRFRSAPSGNRYELSTCISGGGAVSLRQHSHPIQRFIELIQGHTTTETSIWSWKSIKFQNQDGRVHLCVPRGSLRGCV